MGNNFRSRERLRVLCCAAQGEREQVLVCAQESVCVMYLEDKSKCVCKRYGVCLCVYVIKRESSEIFKSL